MTICWKQHWMTCSNLSTHCCQQGLPNAVIAALESDLVNPGAWGWEAKNTAAELLSFSQLLAVLKWLQRCSPWETEKAWEQLRIDVKIVKQNDSLTGWNQVFARFSGRAVMDLSMEAPGSLASGFCKNDHVEHVEHVWHWLVGRSQIAAGRKQSAAQLFRIVNSSCCSIVSTSHMHISIIVHLQDWLLYAYYLYYVSTYPAVLLCCILQGNRLNLHGPCLSCQLPIRWIDLLGYLIRTLTFLGRKQKQWSEVAKFVLISSLRHCFLAPGQWLVPQVLVDRSSPSSECFFEF